MYRICMASGLALFFVFMPPQSSFASTLSVLQEVGAAMESAAKGAKALGDAFQSLVQNGITTFDLVAARNAKERLKDILARSDALVSAQSVRVLPSIEEYLHSPSPQHWELVSKELSAVLLTARDLFEDVKKERSDFVADEAFTKLLESLQGRITILDKLLTVSPPTDKAELTELKSVGEKYSKLVRSLAEANEGLAGYIKHVSDKTPPTN